MTELEQGKVEKHHFVCLPYLNFGNIPEVKLGFATVWNFNILSEKYIPDQALREHVAKTLGNYRASYPYEQDGMDIYPPVHGIGMISVDVPTEKELSELEKQRANDARLILFISHLARRNTITRNANSGHGMASSENYSPIYFSAVVGSKYSTEFTGFVIPSWHGGIEIEKNMIIRPKHIPTPNFDPEVELLNALIKMRLKHKRNFRRLISAVEVFYESYYNAHEVSRNARILLQTSAFEILLDTHSGGGREVLKALLKKEATYPEDRQLSFKSERRGHTVMERGTVREKWADRFFTLRNHITHGHVPKDSEYYFSKWQSHCDIALYFFIFCLKRKIEEAFGKEMFGDDVVWKTWTDDLRVPPQTYTGFEYEHMGQRWWERSMAKLRKQGKL
jgi:hypothetical protein